MMELFIRLGDRLTAPCRVWCFEENIWKKLIIKDVKILQSVVNFKLIKRFPSRVRPTIYSSELKYLNSAGPQTHKVELLK